jgi:hypothetical protein
MSPFGLDWGRHHQRLEGAPEKKPSILPLALVAVSGVLFALQSGLLKLIFARNIGLFEAITVRGAVQAFGVLPVLACESYNGRLPMRHWCGTSPALVRLLVLRAVIGYTGIGFGFAAVQRLSLGDAAALQAINFPTHHAAPLLYAHHPPHRAVYRSPHLSRRGVGGAWRGAWPHRAPVPVHLNGRDCTGREAACPLRRSGGETARLPFHTPMQSSVYA